MDIGNTDQNYWEKILAASDLSPAKEEPQAIEITQEEFQEIANVDPLPEEDYTQDESPVYQGITTMDNRLGSYDLFEEMLTKFDSKEPFFKGHRIIKQRRGNAGNKTGIPRVCPDWAKDNTKIREILLRAFPKINTNLEQLVVDVIKAKESAKAAREAVKAAKKSAGAARIEVAKAIRFARNARKYVPRARASAGRWARIIQLYYRNQLTHGQICAELGVSLPTVFSVIRSIDRTSAGLTANTSAPRKGPRGRPKKNNAII